MTNVYDTRAWMIDAMTHTDAVHCMPDETVKLFLEGCDADLTGLFGDVRQALTQPSHDWPDAHYNWQDRLRALRNE